jgi:transmembrane 9 superfamily protein 2/4
LVLASRHEVPFCNGQCTHAASTLISGLLPFAVISMEAYFLFQSLWQDQYYYMFGFLFLVTSVLIATVAEITIVHSFAFIYNAQIVTYLQLCNENYKWMWRSVWAASGSTWYLLVYGLYHFSQAGTIGMASKIMYGLSFMIVLGIYWLCTGTVGFFTAYLFVRKIYGAVKID